MSASDGVKRSSVPKEQAVLSRLHYVRANVVSYFMLAARKPRHACAVTACVHVGAGALGSIVVIVAAMMLIDAPVIGAVLHLPPWVVATFDWLTDFGKSGWFLVPIAVVLASIAVLTSPALPVISRRVLAVLAVRLGFLFSAIALPGLLVTSIKRVIGRGRPLVGGSVDPFLYLPLGWNVEYASLPSGHATTAFAAAMAIGALWPKTRPLMWTYALVIALSRVVLTAHFPSDVLAGAAAGVAGAALVRAWFASRGLAFAPGENGRIGPLPGPSVARLKKVARQLIAP
jgi:membrane-associated phospholipid phosphatase